MTGIDIAVQGSKVLGIVARICEHKFCKHATTGHLVDVAHSNACGSNDAA